MIDDAVRFHEHVLFRSIVQGGGLLLDLERRAYFALDEVAARVWEALAATEHVAAAVDRLAAEFDVDRTTLEEDVAEFIRNLSTAHLIRIAGT